MRSHFPVYSLPPQREQTYRRLRRSRLCQSCPSGHVPTGCRSWFGETAQGRPLCSGVWGQGVFQSGEDGRSNHASYFLYFDVLMSGTLLGLEGVGAG